MLKPLKAGDHAPDIALPDAKGQIRRLSSFKGHFTLVYFWSSGCSFCLKEDKGLAYSYKEYHNKGFETYAISLDDNVKSWKAALNRNEMRYTQVIDTVGMSSHSVADYGVTSLPFNFLIDQYGDIMMVNVPVEQLFSILWVIYE
jgi:peroxiredoxin